jgi:predicted lipoprotein with Yx(FWY)xxD motif
MNTSGRALESSIWRRVICVAAVSILGLAGGATAVASGTTEVKVIKTHHARILGQQKGYTLYAFCSGASKHPCRKGRTSSKFSPMLAYHTPLAGRGIKKKKLGTRKINGKKVVTYYGSPLYRYKGDKKPGQIKGQGKSQGSGAWWVLTQYGQPQTTVGRPLYG